MGTTNSIIESAIWFARRGIGVLPLFGPASVTKCECAKPDCRSVGKHPWNWTGVNGASVDEATIRSWFEHRPSLNLGVATGEGSGIMVLDVDPRHDGDASLSKKEAEFGKLPDTWTILTGGGGQHFYFRHPGGKVGNLVGFLPGLDLRADGGYVVGPPSRHASGRIYAWEASAHPEEIELAAAPAWLLEIACARRPQFAAGASNWRSAFRSKIQEGKRNATIASLVGHLLRKYVDPYVALELMLAWNTAHADPPLPDDEVYSIVRSMARREYARRQGGRHAS